jgi:transglutaminase-like putative cysteine protease
MLLELTHETTFEYTEPASEAYMEFRLTPVTDRLQHVLQHRYRVTPVRPVRQYADAYGNTVTYFNFLEPHTRVEVRFDSVVETYPTPFRGDGGQTGSVHERVQLYDYQRPTPLTDWCSEFLDYVSRFEHLRGKDACEMAETVCGELHSTFRYEGEVTNVTSPITDILKHGGGVCQDFAHLMLATCRYLGYAARYASGYVLPDDGAEVTASHAWLEVYHPIHGWFGIDPTHNQRTGERYIYLGVGRDYKDVPPNCGIFRGHTEEVMHIRVRLEPISSDEVGRRSRELYTQPRPALPHTRQARKPELVTLMEQSQIVQQQQQQQQ